LDVREPFVADDDDKSQIEEKETKLKEAIKLGKGSVKIANLPSLAVPDQLVR